MLTTLHHHNRLIAVIQGEHEFDDITVISIKSEYGEI